MAATGRRKGRVVMANFVVQLSGILPPHDLDRDGSVRRYTVLRATVQDQAAVYGLLTVLRDLGIDLDDLHRSPPSWTLEGTSAGPPADLGGPLTVEFVIRGSVGGLGMSALRDHVEVTHLSTRLVLQDRRLLNQVLDWGRAAGATVEHAADAPSLAAPPGDGDRPPPPTAERHP